MTGKAAGSAGVCTTDTCLDSITGSEPLFSSDKNRKKLSLPAHKSSTYSARRIGNCFEPPEAAISHPRAPNPCTPPSAVVTVIFLQRVFEIRLRTLRTRPRTSDLRNVSNPRGFVSDVPFAHVVIGDPNPQPETSAAVRAPLD